MIEFLYKAKSKDGEILSGMVEAETESAAASVLMAQDLYPISINRKEVSSFSFFKKVPIKEKSIFIRQLATTIAAGLPISQAIRTIQAQVSNKALLNVLEQVSRDIEAGSALSASLVRFPESFSQIDVTLIAAGETSGSLDKVLLRLADTIEKDYRITKKLRSAFIYPVFVLVVVIGVIFLMSYLVMPQMKSLFESFDAQLPLITRIVVGFTDFVQKYGIVLLVLAIAALIGLRIYIRTDNGRYQWDAFKLKVPIIGPFLVQVYTARFARTLSGLVGSGVSLVDSLEIVSRAVGNKIYEAALLDSAEKVKSGIPLSEPLKNSGMFDPMVPQMIKVGEETGEMDKMLTNLADYFDDEVDTFVRNISSVIEPVLIVVMGGFVAIVLVAIMLPIYSVGNVLR